MKRRRGFALRVLREGDQQAPPFPVWVANAVKDGKLLTDLLVTADMFEAQQYLTRGRVSEVLLGKFRSNGKYYALKGVRKKWVYSTKSFDEVERQMKLHMGLKNRFIANLFRVIDHHSFVYFVLDYCVGGTLELLMQRRRQASLPTAVVKFYAAEIASALDYLHSKRCLVHRNLMLENIGISWNGHVKLLGFGLIVEVTHAHPFVLTQNGDTPTSLEAVAPEFLPPRLTDGFSLDFGKRNRDLERRPVVADEAQDRDHDRGGHRDRDRDRDHDQDDDAYHSFAVDWWSLGVLVFRLAFGYYPFGDREHQDEMEVCEAILYNRRKRKLLRTAAIERKHRATGLLDTVDNLLLYDMDLRWGFEQVKGSAFFAAIDDWTLLHKYEAPFTPRWSLVEGDSSCFAKPQATERKNVAQHVCREEHKTLPSREEIEYCSFGLATKQVTGEAIQGHTLRSRRQRSDGDERKVRHEEEEEKSQVFSRLERGLAKKKERKAVREAMFKTARVGV